MGIIPPKVQDQLAFFNLHAPVWVANATSIGLTSGQATAFAGKAADAQTAWETQQSWKDKARDATADMRVALTDARQDCASLLAIIKGFAENSANPQTVYSLAQIPAPAPPSPVAPPGTPYEPKIQLLPEGWLVLSWKCSNPENASGTIYEVRRRLGASGPSILVGASGTKAFTDDTVPAGTARVTYFVTGVRSTTRGISAQFDVNFGVDGPGLGVTDVTATQVKLAA